MRIVTSPWSESELERFCALPGLSPLTPETVVRHAPDLSALAIHNEPAARCSLWWTETPVDHQFAKPADHFPFPPPILFLD